jgi:hypothetical protein
VVCDGSSVRHNLDLYPPVSPGHWHTSAAFGQTKKGIDSAAWSRHREVLSLFSDSQSYFCLGFPDVTIGRD